MSFETLYGRMMKGKEKLGLDGIKHLFSSDDYSIKVLVDVKGIYKLTDLKRNDLKFWRL